jgi:hypothetical protein
MGRVSKYRKIKSIDPFNKKCTYGKEDKDVKKNKPYNEKTRQLSNRQQEFMNLVRMCHNITMNFVFLLLIFFRSI